MLNGLTTSIEIEGEPRNGFSLTLSKQAHLMWGRAEKLSRMLLTEQRSFLRRHQHVNQKSLPPFFLTSADTHAEKCRPTVAFPSRGRATETWPSVKESEQQSLLLRETAGDRTWQNVPYADSGGETALLNRS